MRANKSDLPLTAVSARLVKEVEEIAAEKTTGRLVIVMHYKCGHLKAADFSRTARISRDQGEPEHDALASAYLEAGRFGDNTDHAILGVVDGIG